MPKITLAGVALEGISTISWALTPGVTPFSTTVELAEETARKIYKKGRGKPITLEMEGEKFENVWALSLSWGSQPDTLRLELADGRAWWSRPASPRAFNIRQRTGNVQLVGKVRKPIRQYIPGVAYSEWSLNKGKAWTVSTRS